LQQRILKKIVESTLERKFSGIVKKERKEWKRDIMCFVCLYVLASGDGEKL